MTPAPIPFSFWKDLDLTVMPDGEENLPPTPNRADVADYLQAFCRQLDFGIGDDSTLLALLEKPETIPTIKWMGLEFLDDSPAYQTLRFLARERDPDLPHVDIKAAGPWAPELPWEKLDRLEGRPPDNSPV